MTKKEIFSRIDHTLLRPTAAWDEIKTLCEEAIRFETASVCIPPCYVRRVREEYPKLCICTVIGFPLGYSACAAKAAEAGQAIHDGADEVDMVINLADVKNGDFQRVTDEIALLKKTVGGHILKVIIETCYLTEQEKISLCDCVTRGGADYIKTSTGFGSAGAKLSDIALFKKYVGPEVKIKAAGGIRTLEDLYAFLNAGCHRIGTSSAVKLLQDAGE